MRNNLTIVVLFFVASLENIKAQNMPLVFNPVNNAALLQYDIRHISITKDNKLWLSTNKGIVRYDGNEVRLFSAHREGTSMTFPDPKDNLYIADLLGLYHLDTRLGTVRYIDIFIDQEDSSNFIPLTSYTDVVEDRDGSIWCGRVNMGLLCYNKISRKAESYHLNYPPGRLNTVRKILFDTRDAGILWLATNNGIFSFNKSTKKFTRRFKCSNSLDSTASDVNILAMQFSGKDTIWFTAGNRGIGCFDLTKGIYTIYPLSKFGQNNMAASDLIFLQPKKNKEFYVGSFNSYPGVFNIQSLRYIYSPNAANESPGLNINHVAEDSLGNMWCINFGRLYLAHAPKQKFSTISLKGNDKLSSGFSKIIWDPKRKYYYVAFGKNRSVSILDSTYSYIKSIPMDNDNNNESGMPPPEVADIAIDQRSNLWAAANSLYFYNSDQQKLVRAESLFKNLTFRDQNFQNLVSSGDYLYLQPSNKSYKAIYRVDIRTFSFDSIPIPVKIIPIPEDELNWGVYDPITIDRTGTYAYTLLSQYLIQINLHNKQVRKIAKFGYRDFRNKYWYTIDDTNNLWIASPTGIKIYDPHTLRNTKNIFHEQNTARVEMRSANGLGMICLLTLQGVVLYDYRNSRQYKLSLSDGLFTLKNSSISCVNNTLFIGGHYNALQYLPLTSFTKSVSGRRCYLSEIQLFNKAYTTDTLPEFLHTLVLPHDKNFVTLSFSSTEFEKPELVEYRYKLTGIDNDWVFTNYLNRTISYPNLSPGSYCFYTSIKNFDGQWIDNINPLYLTILPAWWQTTWFRVGSLVLATCLALGVIQWRVQVVRKQEKQKAKIEKEILELEAKALRAQMSPHFIFNCLNSIKALMHENEIDKGVTYLTTFSKLIRNLFNNADKKQITLYDEIETCKLYLQLEAMRFGNKLLYELDIDENIDLKSVNVPALIIQPLIENAIWHGLVPKDMGGRVLLQVTRDNGIIMITVEDDGIGRLASQQNKPVGNMAHQSKGVNLTQSRLELDNLIQHREANLKIIDKTDDFGNPEGTKVIIRIIEES